MLGESCMRTRTLRTGQALLKWENHLTLSICYTWLGYLTASRMACIGLFVLTRGNSDTTAIRRGFFLCHCCSKQEHFKRQSKALWCHDSSHSVNDDKTTGNVDIDGGGAKGNVHLSARWKQVTTLDQVHATKWKCKLNRLQINNWIHHWDQRRTKYKLLIKLKWTVVKRQLNRHE